MVITVTLVRHGLAAVGDPQHMRDAFEALVEADFGVRGLSPEAICGAFLAAADERDASVRQIVETVH